MLAATQIERIKIAQKVLNERFPFVFNALADPGRFRIFQLLLEYRDICVTDIASIFGITVSAASQQLRILEMTGLVRRMRMGQMICYEVKTNDPLVKSLIKFLS